MGLKQSSSGGGPSPFVNSKVGPILLDSLGVKSVDLDNRYLFDATGLVPTVQWDHCITNDLSNQLSVDWGNRTLNNSTSFSVVDWERQVLRDSVGGTSIDWENHSLLLSGTLIFDWNASVINNSSGSISADFTNKVLFDSLGNQFFTWLNPLSSFVNNPVTTLNVVAACQEIMDTLISIFPSLA